MTPPLWQFVLLALAAYRLTRLVGWDTFPLAVKVRSWATGEIIDHDVPVFMERSEGDKTTSWVERQGVHINLPEPERQYERPWLGHMLECPFCIGFWISLVTCIAWWTSGSPEGHNLGWVGWIAFPLALSGAVGLTAKVLDA